MKLFKVTFEGRMADVSAYAFGENEHKAVEAAAAHLHAVSKPTRVSEIPIKRGVFFVDSKAKLLEAC